MDNYYWYWRVGLLIRLLTCAGLLLSAVLLASCGTVRSYNATIEGGAVKQPIAAE